MKPSNATDASSDYRLKAKQLHKIAHAASNFQRRQIPPRFALSVTCGVVAGFGTIWAFPQNFTLAWLALAAVGVACYRYAPTARTWAESLDNLLSAYEPVNREAYQRLVDRCLEVKGLDVDAVYEWLAVEQEALKRFDSIRPTSELPRFVRKYTADQSRRPPE